MASESQDTHSDFIQLPPIQFGGCKIGRAALNVAILEMNSGAQESGENNSGPWVKKYLNGLAPEGSSWCAGFISFCFSNSGLVMPFQYSVSARDLLNQFINRGWNYSREELIIPEPGDIVVWRRGKSDYWRGHIGIVHHFAAGKLYTIEGNRSTKVQGFIYNYKAMPNLLGLGRVPDDFSNFQV